jgi:dTDP-4-amino-4,6-dideoxygalactose transaminase
MSELHAAVGLVHLRRLSGFLAVRRRVAARYTAGLIAIPQLTAYPVDPEAGPNFYKYPALLSDGIDRAALKDELKRRFGVSLSGEVYETPLHLQPVFQPLANGPLPGAEHVCARHVCLPLHSDMTDDEADRVLSALTTVLPAMRG